MTSPDEAPPPDLFATLRSEFDISSTGDGSCYEHGNTDLKYFKAKYHGAGCFVRCPSGGYHDWADFACPRCGAAWKHRYRKKMEIHDLAGQIDIKLLVALSGHMSINCTERVQEAIGRLRKRGCVETGWEYIPCTFGKAYRSLYLQRTTKGEELCKLLPNTNF